MKKILAIFILILTFAGCNEAVHVEHLIGKYTHYAWLGASTDNFYFTTYEKIDTENSITYVFYDRYEKRSGEFTFIKDLNNSFLIKKNPNYREGY